MKTTMKLSTMLLLMLWASAVLSQDKKATTPTKEKSMSTTTMNTYVIERQIPEAGALNAADLQGISQKSCSVIKELGPEIEWVQSYVTNDKIFCVYRAANESILKEHAEKGGFPINSINQLSAMISPATATAKLEEIKKD